MIPVSLSIDSTSNNPYHSYLDLPVEFGVGCPIINGSVKWVSLPALFTKINRLDIGGGRPPAPWIKLPSLGSATL